MEDGSVLPPLRREFEKVSKRQRQQQKKNASTLDGLLKELDKAKKNLTAEGSNPKKVVAELSNQVKEAKGTFNSDQKECYSLISKLGKALDKSFKVDFDKMQETNPFEGKKDLLDKVIVNHLLRQSHFALGEMFAKEAGLEVEDSTKTQFLEMFKITEAIQGRNLAPALEWAFRNRASLETSGSSLEFKLHQLQFITLLSSGNKMEALRYARGNFGHFSSQHIKDIQRLMGCFLFVDRLGTSPYADLVQPHHWEDIKNHFTKDCCALMNLSHASALYTSFVVGSTALPCIWRVTRIMQAKKTEWSQQNELPVEVPLRQENHYHSIFVCPVAKEQVTEENPPVLLPCGHAICNESLSKIVKPNGRFKCPYCPTDANKSAVKKIVF